METKQEQSERRTRELGEEPIKKLLLKFSIPAIVGMLVQALYSAVDQIFVGKYVGHLAVGGIATMMPMTFILVAFAMLIGVGGTAIVSIRLGQKRKDEADRVCANTLGFAIILGSLISLAAFIFLNRLPYIFGASDKNFIFARDYISVVLFGYPIAIVSYAMNGYIRSEGNPNKAMSTLLIGAAANIFLDYLCVGVFKMGVKGAAAATVISQTISMVWVLSYFFSGRSNLSVNKESAKLEFEIFIQVIQMGFSPFVMQIITSFVITITTRSLLYYGGEDAVSAMAIINSFSGIIFMPIIGVNQGAQPIIGYNFGAKLYERVKETCKYAILISTLIAALGFILSEFFPRAIFRIYLSHSENLETFLNFAAPANQIYNAAFFMVGLAVVGGGYFQSTGQPKLALFLSLSRQLIFLLPMLIIMPKFLGVWGVFAAMPVSDFLASVLSFYMMKRDFKKYE